jgi:FMN reductase
MRESHPYVVGLGGTTRANSSTEKALAHALAKTRALGGETKLLGSETLGLPLYAPEHSARTPSAETLVRELRRADIVLIASPAYHGGPSGLVKNALDYIEDMSTDDAPYLQGRAIGLIATGAGWQGAVNTLNAMRAIVHALRGWNAPLGIAINTAEPAFDASGACIAPKLDEQCTTLARELIDFSQQQRSSRFRTSLHSARG